MKFDSFLGGSKSSSPTKASQLQQYCIFVFSAQPKNCFKYVSSVAVENTLPSYCHEGT